MKRRSIVPRASVPTRAFLTPGGFFGGEIDRLFDNFLQGFPESRATEVAKEGGFIPSVNVEETDRAYLVTAEVPGLDEGDLDISIDTEGLVLAGEKKFERKEEKGTQTYYESSYGSFRRLIPLASEVDADKIEASLKKGVLTIELPKREEKASKRTISVKAH